MAVIGIDLGTTYSAAAVYANGGAEIIHLEGEPTLPSVVGLQKNGKIAIGKTAKRNQERFPQNTIVEVKRKMGKNEQVQLGEKSFKPQEISAMILRRIKELAEAELGEEITGAVISCPAYFKEPARHATQEAGEIAGLKILRILNEPTAAAYAYTVLHKQDADDGKEKLYLVYDLGGGTFDVTVIRMVAGSIEVIGTGGDPELGGGNFDDQIVEWMKKQIFSKPEYAGYEQTLTDDKKAALNLRLKSYAEEGKKALCNAAKGDAYESNRAQIKYEFNIGQVDIYQGKPIRFNETLTMETFEELIGELMKKSFVWVEEALKVPAEKHKYTKEHLTAILLVGGSTRVPLVRQMLQEHFPQTEIRGQESGLNPDEIVALGASIVAAEEDPGSVEIPGHGGVLVDVTGHTLSVAVWDEYRNREMLHSLIQKETPIPCAAAHRFQSEGRGQSRVNVKVYQGEGEEITPETMMIGSFIIEIDPIQPPTPLQIGLNLDDNGILVAHARNELNGQEVKCKIDYSDSAQMDKAELEQKKAQLDAQLNAVIGMTANPLDGGGAAATTGTSPAQPQPAPTQPTWPQPMGALDGGTQFPPNMAMPAPAPPPPAADPTSMMNPIIRNLYQKAINSFDRVPPERQGAVMQLVMEIENAARMNDQTKLMSYYPQLMKLLEGIS